jgi:hypothetical protein
MYMLVTYMSVYNMYKAYVSPGWEQQIMLFNTSTVASAFVACLAVAKERPPGNGWFSSVDPSGLQRARHNMVY